MCSCSQHDPRQDDEHQALLAGFAQAFVRARLVANAREMEGPVSTPIAGVQSPWDDNDGRYFGSAEDAARHRQWQREATERAARRRAAASARRHAVAIREAGDDDVSAFLSQLATSLEVAA